MTACASPTSGASVGTLLPISAASMSSWMTRRSSRQRGGSPKCSIQFIRAPMRKTTSVFLSALVRAAETFIGWSSGTTPLPIGIGRKGSPVLSMNSRTSFSACAQAAPLPTTTSGFEALFSVSSAWATSPSAASGRGGSGTRSIQRTSSSSTLPSMMLPGMSR